MKRILAVVSLAVLAVPAIGADDGAACEKVQIDRGQPFVQKDCAPGLPFEQTQLDRGVLADVADGASSPSSGATYERQVDGGVPPNTVPHEHGVKKDPVWSKDPHFIAPPQ